MSWPPTAQQGERIQLVVGVDFNTTSLHLIFVSHVVQNLFHFGKKEIHSEFSQC